LRARALEAPLVLDRQLGEPAQAEPLLERVLGIHDSRPARDLFAAAHAALAMLGVLAPWGGHNGGGSWPREGKPRGDPVSMKRVHLAHAAGELHGPRGRWLPRVIAVAGQVDTRHIRC
jgi:hypothetical protein